MQLPPTRGAHERFPDRTPCARSHQPPCETHVVEQIWYGLPGLRVVGEVRREIVGTDYHTPRAMSNDTWGYGLRTAGLLVLIGLGTLSCTARTQDLTN